MFEDYYLDDPYMQRSLIDAGYYTTSDGPMTTEAETVSGIGSPAATTAATNPAATTAATTTAATTNPAATSGSQNLTYEQLADRRAQANTLPRGTYFVAPTGGRGETTGFETPGQQSNSFQYRGGPVRVVDFKGNVLFSGEGPEGAVDAARFAQNLSDTKGPNASWDLQEGERTINPDGSVGPMRWISGPSTRDRGMGAVGDLIAFVAPIAMAIATAGMSLPAQIAIAAATGAVTSVVSGNDPLRGALTAAITTGLSSAGGKYAGNLLETGGALGTNVAPALAKAIGTGVGATTGGLVTGSSLENALLSGAASGALSYYGPQIRAGIGDIGDAIDDAFNGINVTGGGTSGVNINTGGGRSNSSSEASGTNNAGTVVTAGGTTGGVNVGGTAANTGTATTTTQPAETTVEEERPGTVVTGTGTTGGVNVGGTAANTGTATTTTQPAETTVEEERPGTVVTGTGTTGGVNVGGIGGTGTANTGTATTTTRPAETTVEEERPGTVVTGTGTTGGVNVGGIGGTAANTGTATTTTRPAETTVEEERPGTVVTGLETIPGVNVGGIGDTGRLGDPTSLLPDNFFDEPVPEESTLDRLRDAAEVVAAAATVGGVLADTVGGSTDSGTRTTDTSGLTLTTGTLRPTIPGGTGGTSGIGGTSGRYPYTPQTYGRRGGDQETEYLFFTRDPVTGQGSVQSGVPVTTTGTTSASSAMVAPSGNTFAEGGEVDDDMVRHLVEYHKNGGHQGPGQVKGIGSGQDDKIPAWLSDGEYVWSAQDVADLGDGSTDEGVRRLDKMRQMVRRQAGRKDVKKIAKPQKGIDRMLKAVGGLA